MILNTIATICMLAFLVGCSQMKPTDFQGTSPKLVLEKYFLGKTQASGIFEDRFGNLRRQFVVDITGTWDGEELILDERFKYNDGELDRRMWYIRKTGPNTYTGSAADVVGLAEGEAYGNAINWRYDLNLKVGARTFRVHFNDWMYLLPSGILLNKARVSKLGVEIGTVTLAFTKENIRSGAVNHPLNEWISTPETLRVPSQRKVISHRSSKRHPNNRYVQPHDHLS